MALRDITEAIAVDEGWMTKAEIAELRRQAQQQRIREFMRRRYAAKKAEREKK